MSSLDNKNRGIIGHVQPSTQIPTTPQIRFEISTPSSSHSHFTQQGSGDTTGFAFSDLLPQLEDYNPTVPDSIGNHYLHTSGFESRDPRLGRLISLVAQKRVSDILSESIKLSKSRLGIVNTNPGPPKKTRQKIDLRMDDLSKVFTEIGVNIKPPSL